MSKDQTKLLKYIPTILATIVVFIFFLYLIKNIDYVKVPNSDFFQYINESHQYLNFKLPNDIGVPPLSPILIGILSIFFTSSTKYPELLSAHIINIVCSTLALLNIFLIFKKSKPWIGFSTILLLATNKIYIANSLNITNEVLYYYFLTTIILLYSKKYFRLSYLLSGLCFLIRYESIVLPLSIFVLEFFQKTKKRFKVSNVLLAFLPILFWLIILNFRNYGGSIIQNHYIDEIIAEKNNIPNLQPINSLLDIIVSNPINYFLYKTFNLNLYPTLPSKITNIFFPIIIMSFCLIKIIPKKNNFTNKIIFLTFLSHTTFISLFPNFSIRYMFPVFWILYLLIIDQKSKKLTIILISILLLINISGIKDSSIYDMFLDKSENQLIAEWIDQQNFNIPTNIVTHEYYITEYFLSQTQNVIFNEWITNGDSNNFYKILTNCNDNILCLFKTVTQNNPKKNQFFFITTSSSSPNNTNNLDDQYFVQKSHLKAFRDQNLSNEDRKYLKLITVLKQDDYHWAKIYQYQPQ